MPINILYIPEPLADSEYNIGKLQQATCIAVAFPPSYNTFSLGIHQLVLGGSIGSEGSPLGFATLPWEGLKGSHGIHQLALGGSEGSQMK